MSKRIDYETIYNIVTNLIGSIQPAGETHTDNIRKENLKQHIRVMNMLVDDVLFLIDRKDDYRASIKEIGEIANKEIKGLAESLSEALEELE